MKITGKLNPDVYYQAEIDGIDSGYFASSEFSKERYIRTLSELPSVGYEHNGEDIGGAVLVGNRLHLAVSKQYKGLWASLLKPTLSWAFAIHNPLVVCISTSNYLAMRLLDATSFRFIESKDDMNTFEIRPKELI
jgi:hypothetical protein